ncbi:MAG: TetR family transcriptional regulator [Propionicimonas sp.]|nr:TetR family transcriptional regulator [Propionicimonas sp.]MEA5116783.1 TetR family transcriptional regulator [Propionicimonas sp.]
MPKTASPVMGRRPGPGNSRQAILTAASELFAERGYEGASLRAITSRAGVDVAMVRNFFGDKHGLFVEAVVQQTEISEPLAHALAEGTDGLGERYVHAYLDTWELEPYASASRALFRSALDSERAMEALRANMQLRLTNPVDQSLIDRIDPERMLMASSQLFGVAFVRYVLQLEPVASMSRDEIAAHLAPMVEHYLT